MILSIVFRKKFKKFVLPLQRSLPALSHPPLAMLAKGSVVTMKNFIHCCKQQVLIFPLQTIKLKAGAVKGSCLPFSQYLVFVGDFSMIWSSFLGQHLRAQSCTDRSPSESTGSLCYAFSADLSGPRSLHLH